MSEKRTLITTDQLREALGVPAKTLARYKRCRPQENATPRYYVLEDVQAALRRASAGT